MTISEVLAQVDELKPNQYSDEMKIMWLSELDAKIFDEIISTHEDGIESFDGYSESDISKELIADGAYAGIYRHYLSAQIDYSNSETDRYANSMLMFNQAYTEFARHYNKTHKPLSEHLKVF